MAMTRYHTKLNLIQARSKQYLICPAITKLSAGDLGARRSIQWGSRHIPGTQMHFKQNIV